MLSSIAPPHVTGWESKYLGGGSKGCDKTSLSTQHWNRRDNNGM